jgi:hemerythrin superfamily protein
MADPFTLLELDHRSAEELLEKLSNSAEGPERNATVDELVKALQAHMEFEEQAIYPLVPVAMDQEKEEEAESEHRLAREGLEKLTQMAAAPGFGAVVDMVKAGIGHHVKEEETEMFPTLRDALDADQQASLAQQLVKAKQHAGLPLVGLEDPTKAQLEAAAAGAGIEVSSSMTKAQMQQAVSRAG